MIFEANLSQAQVLGEKAELFRLEDKAEDAIAQGDPNGAALTIGKAALMASVLAEKETNPQTRQIYDGAEALFRAQENGYRALALFEQAGGQLPPPGGVCQLLGLAQQNGEIATQKLAQVTIPTVERRQETLVNVLLNTRLKNGFRLLKNSRRTFPAT